MRMAACKALGSHQRPESIVVLQRVIGSDTNDQVRLTAVRSLENFRNDPTAVQALGLALEDGSGVAMQYRAMESLKKVTGKNFSGNVETWQAYVRGEPVLEPERPSYAESIKNIFR